MRERGERRGEWIKTQYFLHIWFICMFCSIQGVCFHYRCCMNLQYLSLAFCNKFSDRGLIYLATGKFARKLEYLDMSGCLQLTPRGFQNLADGCFNLTSIILDDFPTLMDESIMVRTFFKIVLNHF